MNFIPETDRFDSDLKTMRSIESFEDKIIKNFDKYYIKWVNCFDKRVFELLYDLKNYEKNQNLQDMDLTKKQEKELELLYIESGSKYKNKFERNLIKFCYLNKIDFNECLKITINQIDSQDKEKTKLFLFEETINFGSSGAIFMYKVENNKYTLKIPFKGEEDTSKTESTIHYILFHYQKFVNQKIVPDIEFILMTKDNFYYIMMEKLEYELYKFFEKYGPLTKILKLKDNKFKIIGFDDNSSKWNFFLELLYQISNKLILLQDSFKFMHNDLKCNNILVKVNESNDSKEINIDYILCDFGGSSCDFQNISYVGTVLCSDSKFNKKKDLFMLLHMFLGFSPRREQIIKFIERNQIFNLSKNLISSRDHIWKKSYTYIQDGNIIDESFDPRNLKRKLEKMRNNPKNFS